MIVLWWFAETTLVAGILALVAAIAGWRGRLSPAMRHGLWVVAARRVADPAAWLSWPGDSPRLAVADRTTGTGRRGRHHDGRAFPEASSVPSSSTESSLSLDLSAAIPEMTVGRDRTRRGLEIDPPPLPRPAGRWSDWTASGSRSGWRARSDGPGSRSSGSSASRAACEPWRPRQAGSPEKWARWRNRWESVHRVSSSAKSAIPPALVLGARGS